MAYDDEINKIQQSTILPSSPIPTKGLDDSDRLNSKERSLFGSDQLQEPHHENIPPPRSHRPDRIWTSNQVIVSVLPDATLIDFSKVRLVTVNWSIRIRNQIDVKQEFKLTQGATVQPGPSTPGSSKTSYTWTASFYMAHSADGGQDGARTSSDTDLILMMRVDGARACST